MILPVQIFGVIICLAHGLLAGIQEKRLGAGLISEQDFKSPEVTDKTSRDKKIFIFNVLLTLTVIAAPALMMCSTLLAAAVLMGILVKDVTVDGAKIPGVINCMSNLVTLILPETFGEHLPVIIGVLSAPL